MKTRQTNTFIGLKELPPEGETFLYTHESGELNETLKELIGKNPYRVEFHITPMGNTFDLKGTISTSMNLQCSLCALDFNFPVEQILHEVLIVNKPLSKGDQLTKANHAHEWESQGPDYILLETEGFNVGEYIHEMIALAEPIKPLGKPDCDQNCENLKDQVQRSWLTIGEDKGFADERSKPFRILEKFKLKS